MGTGWRERGKRKKENGWKQERGGAWKENQALLSKKNVRSTAEQSEHKKSCEEWKDDWASREDDVNDTQNTPQQTQGNGQSSPSGLIYSQFHDPDGMSNTQQPGVSWAIQNLRWFLYM